MIELVIFYQGFLYKEGLYYCIFERGTRSGLESTKEEESEPLFPFRLFQFYQLTKGLLPYLSEKVKYSLSDHLNINIFNALIFQYSIEMMTLFH